MAMQGNLKDMNLADLIQHICLDKRTVWLAVKHGQQQAILFLDEGKIVHAELGDVEGEEVVYEALQWQQGTFKFEAGRKSPRKTIDRHWSTVLLEGARRLDESNQSSNSSGKQSEKEQKIMADVNETLQEVMKINGAMAAALVDWKSGMTLGTIGSGMNIDLAAAGNTNVVRSKLSVMRDLKLKGTIEDILITLSEQYHLIRLLHGNANLFLYLALDREQANLGMARHKLAALEQELEV